MDESSFKDIKLQKECIMGLKHNKTTQECHWTKIKQLLVTFYLSFYIQDAQFFFINIHLLGSFRRVIFVYVGIARIIVISILQLDLIVITGYQKMTHLCSEFPKNDCILKTL